MKKNEVRDILIEMLKSLNAEELHLNNLLINDETSIREDFALDSIRLLDFLVSIENRFEIAIEPHQFRQGLFDKLSNLVDYITEKKN